MSDNYALSGVCGASIRGNLQASRNSGMVLVAGNDLDGNLHAIQHLNALTISFNAIKGNLRCDQNIVPPRAYGNKVGGNREGGVRRSLTRPASLKSESATGVGEQYDAVRRKGSRGPCF